jgi:predicted nucleic acid-binding protein
MIFRFSIALSLQTAIEAGYDTLYTEDMQNGLIVENQLRIINPFV